MAGDSLEFVILTGMSGAGKSTALHTLEDIGFYCMDNLPPPILPKVAELSLESRDRRRVASVCDVRTQNVSDELLSAFQSLVGMENVHPVMIFLDAETPVLVRRFSETRRKHPLGEYDGLELCIERERALLKALQEKADIQINTSRLSIREFQESLIHSFSSDVRRRLVLTVTSFGYKYGLPGSADVVIDVRFLPNPFYDPNLKHLTGLDPAVREFVHNAKDAGEFLKRTQDWLEFLIPKYVEEGKAFLNVAVGCTGGRHRSVVIAEDFKAFVLGKFGRTGGAGVAAGIFHRDIGK